MKKEVMKLHLQKLRLKVSGESDRTGQGPYDVVLSAVLEVADEVQVGSEKATVLQAAWRRRNVQGKFQTAVQEMMEINGIIEGVEEKEKELAGAARDNEAEEVQRKIDAKKAERHEQSAHKRGLQEALDAFLDHTVTAASELAIG